MKAEAELAPRRPRRLVRRRRRSRPLVRLGRTAADGVAPSMYALLDRGASLRPELAGSIRGTALFEFDEGYAPLLVRFEEGAVTVSDERGADPDLVVRGALPAIVHFATAPQMAGIPNPVRAKGLKAIAAVARGRVRVEGEMALARRIVRLLAL